MKIKNIFILTCSIYLLYSCGNNLLEEMPSEENTVNNEYPKKYVFTEFVFNPSEFYTFQIDDFQQFIPDAGELLLVDSALNFDFFIDDPSFVVFPFKEFELLSDSLVRLKIEGDGYISTDTTFRYQKSGEDIIYTDNVNGFFRLNEDQSQLKYCYQITAYSYYNEQKKRRDYSTFRGRACTDPEKIEILEKIVSEESQWVVFQPNDTIILNTSDFIMDLIE